MKSKKIIFTISTLLVLTATSCVSESKSTDEAKDDTVSSEAAAPAPTEVAKTEGTNVNAAEVVAEVSGEKITRGQLDAELKRQLRGQEATIPEEQMHTLRSKLLEKMIERELLFQATVGKDFAAPEEQLQQTLTAIKGQVGSEEAFNQVLAKENVSNEEFMEQLKRDLAVNNYIGKQVLVGLSISDEEATEFYKKNTERFAKPAEVHARHILFKVAEDGKNDAEQKKKAEETLKKVKTAGTDFGALAKEVSECPSAPKGGDLGFFTENQMVAPFSQAAFAMKVGDISDIVKTDFGYHIIKVEDRHEAGTATLDEVREDLKKALLRDKQQAALVKHLEDLKAKSKIVTYLK